MDDLGAFLMLLSLIGTIVGIVGLIKGSIKMLKIFRRKQAGLLILSCFILFVVGGIMVGTGATGTPSTMAGDVDQVNQTADTDGTIDTSALPDEQSEQEETTSTDQNTVSGSLEVHFIDVGQADSILIKAPGGNMLIDAGNNADSNLVTSYIKKQGIEKLDVVIGTHPHEDHIGGLDAVIDSFDIGKVYMPKVAHTTKTFEDVLIAVQNKRLTVTTPDPGTTFDVGDAKCTVMAPNSSSYDDLNNYSIVIKMEYGNNSFLFTGDAEDISEREMLNKGFDLSADVIKVGHHGSSSSTTQNFLDKVNPKYAVIMVGTDNNYGHPHKETMDKLKSKNIPVYRTDENGTIVATSDGNNITFNTQPGSYTSRGSDGTSSSNTGTTSSNTSSKTTTNSFEKSTDSSTKNDSDRIVYWTPNGKSYHYTKDCPTLSRSKKILSGPLSECPKSDPCDKCAY